jgi:hypothetical protein
VDSSVLVRKGNLVRLWTFLAMVLFLFVGCSGMSPPPENPEKEGNAKAEKQPVQELTDEVGVSVATNQETTSQDQLPRDVLATQYKFINNSEYAKAYALFAAQSQELVSREQYEAYFENNAPYSIDDYSFLSTNVSGNVASVVVNLAVSSSKGEDQYQVTQQLVREDGRWRVVMRDAQLASFTGAQGQSPEDVLASQYEHINLGEYGKAYALFAEQSQQLVSPEQYRAFFEANAPYLIANHSFPSMQVQGETATVDVVLTTSSAGGEDQYQITQQLVREDGRWRVVMRDAQVATFIGAGSASASSASSSATQSADASATANPSAGGAVPPISEEHCPPNAPIKGNASSSIYHMPDDAYYDATHPEACFATPQDAEAAGYRAAEV